MSAPKLSTEQSRVMDYLRRGYRLEITQLEPHYGAASLRDDHYRHVKVRLSTAAALNRMGLIKYDRKYLSGKHSTDSGWFDVWTSVFVEVAR